MRKQIIVVDEENKPIGYEYIAKVHQEGLWHRSSNIFLFTDATLEHIVLSRLSPKHANKKSTGKWHCSAGGHVEYAQTYETTAYKEVQEELFAGRELPKGFHLVGITPSYRNVSRSSNKEFSRLYIGIHAGPFTPNPQEIDEVKVAPLVMIAQDMCLSPNDYTNTSKLAMEKLLEYKVTSFS